MAKASTYLFAAATAFAAFAILPVTNALASTYLVGASLTFSNGVGTHTLPGVRYTTNSADPGAAALPIDLVGDSMGAVFTDISYELTNGTNTFAINRSTSPLFPSFLSLNLFFNTTGTPFAPGASDPVVGGDLVAIAPNFSTSSFFIPLAGTQVANFNTDALLNAAYSGATSLLVGNALITFSQFDISHTFGSPTGLNAVFSLDVEISAVPVPAALPLFGTAIALMGYLSWRRKRNIAVDA